MEFSQPRPAIAIMGFFFFDCDVLLMAIEGVFRGFWGEQNFVQVRLRISKT